MIGIKDIVLEAVAPSRGLGRVIAMAGNEVQVVFGDNPPVLLARDKLARQARFPVEQTADKYGVKTAGRIRSGHCAHLISDKVAENWKANG
jgi:hypothetical protein